MTEPGHSTFGHLAALTDQRGLFEHARSQSPRVEHGYCTDDNARLLVVTSRETDDAVAASLSRVALRFTVAAQKRDGRTHNRMNRFGRWTDRPTTDDCWGRSLWGFGTAAAHHPDPAVADEAFEAFDRGVVRRSRWPRAMAFAALGTAEVVGSRPTHGAARALLLDAVTAIGIPRAQPWVWPETRLRYANAALAEAVLAAGAALGDPAVVDRGLSMLRWLLDLESGQGHLSVTGVGGRGRTDVGRQFDQQPIEVAAMADACCRALSLTGDAEWAHGVALAAAWFDGANDAQVSVRDLATGAGFDGLRSDGVNLNCGAESTLALVSTMQRADALERLPS